MRKRIFSDLATMALMALTLMACAGPSTPFGSLEAVEENPVRFQLAEQNQKESENSYFLPSIYASPDRQILHDRMNVTVAVEDNAGFTEAAKMTVWFNDMPIKTKSDFVLPPENNKKGYVAFKNLYLRPDRQNKIKFTYQRHSRAPKFSYSLKEPTCDLSQVWDVDRVANFNVPESLREQIVDQSRMLKVNPALVMGLIAQESAFNPKAVSWAKAIGLTQVTPIGDRQIAKAYPNWPRSEKILQLPFPLLKVMIDADKIKDDWRLDTKKSITGGIHLLKEMSAYWKKKPLPMILTQPEEAPPLEDLTLASYHSGAHRVFEAIQEKGMSYLDHAELKEAKKYVNRVKSYCYHFAKTPTTKVAKR